MSTTTATATEFGLRQVSLSSAASRELVRRGVCEGAIRLYAYLAAHSRNHSGEAFASQRYLAAELGRTARTIRNYLRQLEDAGAVATRYTGRTARYRVADLSGTVCRTTAETAFRRNDRREIRRGEEEVVSTAPAPPVATTTPSIPVEDELPTAGPLREELAEAIECETTWRETEPEAQEREQAAERRRWFSTRLAWLDDVRRVAEAVAVIDGWRGHRGTGGVSGPGDLWRLRVTFGSMASADWRRSVLRWCRHHQRRRGRLGDLYGWLLRERYEEVEPPPAAPPDLPPAPTPSDAAIEPEDVIVYRCATGTGACRFIRHVVRHGEAAPERCARCGGALTPAENLQSETCMVL